MSGSSRAGRIGTIDSYRQLRQIGEGTYGKVYLCEDKQSGKQVAIKKVQISAGKEGFPQTAVREIKLLAQLRHENIVRLEHIVTPPKGSAQEGDTIFMVFEYMDHDLEGLLRDTRVTLTAYHIKWWMKQLTEGLKFCHDKRMLHRDIKASNILIDNMGNLKLADFGLARNYSETCSDTKYSNKVITLWYRPPELLLGSETYGPAVDMWSVGCILAQMVIGKPAFMGANHIDQLEVIFKLCGTPTQSNWPTHSELPWYQMFRPPHMIDRCLRPHLESIDADHSDEHAVDLLDKLLVLDPARRMTAEKMLDHDWFYNEPLPQRRERPEPLLPENVSCHEYETKQAAKARPRESGGGEGRRSRAGDGGAQAPTSPTGAGGGRSGRDAKRRRSSSAGGPRIDEHGELIRDSSFKAGMERRRGSSSSGADAAYDPLAPGAAPKSAPKQPKPQSTETPAAETPASAGAMEQMDLFAGVGGGAPPPSSSELFGRK